MIPATLDVVDLSNRTIDLVKIWWLVPAALLGITLFRKGPSTAVNPFLGVPIGYVVGRIENHDVAPHDMMPVWWALPGLVPLRVLLAIVPVPQRHKLQYLLCPVMIASGLVGLAAPLSGRLGD